MTFAKIILTLLASTLTLASCRSASVQKSKSKEFSCNLADSERESSAASKAAFQCAYNSLRQAGKLAGPGFANDVLDVYEGYSEVRGGLEDAEGLLAELSHFVETNGQDPGAGAGLKLDDGEESNGNSGLDTADKVIIGVDGLKGAFEGANGKVARTAMYQCLGGQYEAAKKFYNIAKLGITMKDQEKLSSDQLRSMVSMNYDFTQIVFNLIEANGRCAEWLGQKRILALQRVLRGIGKIQGPIESIRVVANCGIDLTKGGYVLVANTACLAGDIKNYYESKDRLEKTRDNYVNNIPVQDNESGARACMAKYGLWLQKQSFYSYVYRSSVCADYCGNGSRGADTFSKNINSIFTIESDREWCGKNAVTAQGAENITACASYCCNQDNQCTTDAMKRAGF